MASASEIREIILEFVRHRDANAFVLQFSRLSFDIRNRGNAESIQLAHSIERKIAEVSVGHARAEALCESVSMLCGDVLQEAERLTLPTDFYPNEVSTGTSTSLALVAAAGAAVGGLVGAGRAWEYASEA